MSKSRSARPVGPPILLHTAPSPTWCRREQPAPDDGDPDVPASLATLGLHAVVEPASPQVLWMVDGRPFAVADYPYTARWPLAPGEHVIQARLPFTDITSTPVKVLVQ